MLKSLRKNYIAVVAVITIIFVSMLCGMYVKLKDTVKDRNINIYSASIKMQYDALNEEVTVIDNLCRKLQNNPDFENVLNYKVYGDRSVNLSQSSWNVYSYFTDALQQNKYITDSYIIFKNSNSLISKQTVQMNDNSVPDLSCDGYSYSFLRSKVFSSSLVTILFYSDKVYYNGKESEALLYCRALDGNKLNISNSAVVSIIPLDKIENILHLNKVFGNKAIYAIYNTEERTYESGSVKNISDYSVIDCDSNKNFSLCVYIENDFFSGMTVYYYNIISIFIAYVIICGTIIILAYKKQRAFSNIVCADGFTRPGIIEQFEVNNRLNRLLTGRSDSDECQWFRDNLPDFPRPCIIALFKTEGADSFLVDITLEELGCRPAYIYCDINGHITAFFNYQPDGERMSKIKNVLERFIEKLEAREIRAVISLSNPCMDVDEIYEAYRTSELMFKYNEYNNLICAGDISNKEGFIINAEDNNRILKYILSENAFDANKIIYSQWYELSQNPSFGDEIERLFVSQIGVLASASVKVDYDRELPKYNSRLSVTELAFVVTDAVNDIVEYIETNRNNSTLYNDVISYIDENFTNPDLSQPDIKEKFGISTKVITKILKQKKNMLFSEYLETLRINKARYILAHSDIKIYDISKMCGYGTNDAFYKAFNKKTGMTPGAYRKANGQQKQGKEKK